MARRLRRAAASIHRRILPWLLALVMALQPVLASGSVTRSGISGGAVRITDEAGQKALTGKGAEETLAGLDRGALSGKDGANALKPIFDEREIQAGFEVVGALQREIGAFLDNRAKEIDRKNAQAKEAEGLAADMGNGLTDEERLALVDQSFELRAEARALNDDWGAGGTYRQIATALMAGAGGNVAGGTAQFAQDMLVNYVQQKGAGYIGQLVAQGAVREGSPAHAALHAIAACAGAAASRQSCGAGAAGAAAGSLLAGLFGEARQQETATERQAKANLVTSLVTGIAAMGGIDAATASASAAATTDNNWLATQQRAQMARELAEAATIPQEAAIYAKWVGTSATQDLLTTSGFIGGLASGLGEDLQGMAAFLADVPAGLKAIKEVITEPDVRAQLGDALFRELDAKIDRMGFALEHGGTENAFLLGKEAGEIVWHAASAVTVVKGLATGSAKLAGAGIRAGSRGLGAMLEIAALESQAAKGGGLTLKGTSLMDLRNLKPVEKTRIGEVFGEYKVRQVVPDGQKLAKAPSIGEQGIDDLYRVGHPDVDYVFVEYKFVGTDTGKGSSNLGKTRDGRQGSEGWIMGSNRIERAVGDKAVAKNIAEATKSGRYESWVIATRPDGSTFVEVLDAMGRPKPLETSRILKPDTNLLGAMP